MFIVMTEADGVLLAIAEVLAERGVPRVGWPTMMLPPVGTQVRAHEHGPALTIRVTLADAEAVVRVDLETWEIAAASFGENVEVRERLRRAGLAFAADRSDFEEGRGVNTHPELPDYDLDDVNTWTEMQLFAHVTGSLWYPPLPRSGDVAGAMQFATLSAQFNQTLRD